MSNTVEVDVLLTGKGRATLGHVESGWRAFARRVEKRNGEKLRPRRVLYAAVGTELATAALVWAKDNAASPMGFSAPDSLPAGQGANGAINAAMMSTLRAARDAGEKVVVIDLCHRYEDKPAQCRAMSVDEGIPAFAVALKELDVLEAVAAGHCPKCAKKPRRRR